MNQRHFHVMQVMPWSGTQTPFAEVIASLAWGLGELGYQTSSSLNTWATGARHIVLCPHLLTDATISSLPADTIFYNLEQIDPLSPLPPSRLTAFNNRIVWDFSDKNLLQWRRHGIAAVKMPIGWYPNLSRISPSAEKSIDLLFYGVLNRRRIDSLNALARAGLKVHVARGVYSSELDNLLAQARAVLNVHCYPAGIFESVRASLPLANGIPVISERADQTEVPEIFSPLVHWATYADLADVCVELLADDNRLREPGERSRHTLSNYSVAALLQQALSSTESHTKGNAGYALPTRPRIPKIIHFVNTGDENLAFEKRIDTWRERHPDATVRIWDRDTISEIPWFNAHHIHEMAAHDMAAAVDLIRWEILFREGGISPDIGSTCLNTLPDWILECEMFAGWENEIIAPGLISTAVVGSVAANPFLLRLIQDIGRHPSLIGRAAREATGTLALTDAHRRYRYSNLTVLPSHFFAPRHHSGTAYVGNGPVFADQEWEVPQRIGQPAP